MNFPFFIAKRYILGKKSHNAINIVSAISVAGVIVGTIAFILILSVFNGFDELVRGMYNSFYSDVKVVPAKGKVFSITEDTMNLLKAIDGVAVISEVIEDNALLVYNEKQTVSRIKGVSDNFNQVTGIDSLIWDGEYKLYYQSMPRAVIGRGLSYNLGLHINAFELLKIYVPSRTAGNTMDPNKALNQKYTLVTGIFSSQPDIDGKYAIVPIEFARNLFDYPGMLSSLEIKLNDGANEKKVIEKLLNILGDNFLVKDRYMQNEVLYKTMRTEKWAIFLILALVLIILLFSLVGSISMLIIEKKKDISILNSLGANRSLLQKIFFSEGFLITTTGLLIGLFTGSIICLLQENFGLVKLHGGFIIDAYPVDLQLFDVFVVASTVLLIGAFSSWYPVRLLLKRNFQNVNQV
ncbi:MAG: ABC transporter permease [Bacteroidales bacterium]|nr:ABC transporter permease [Bacteroidales bacterium]MBN2820827.1 ABC transporter permease [Bacteroidales bacterium]